MTGPGPAAGLRAVPAAPVLLGRAAETAAVTGLLERARFGGSGGVLVLRGEAGIGKSALLERARSEATGMRVLSGIGVPAEATLPYAGLHLLLREVSAAETAALPPAQAEALCGALGRGTAGHPPADRFLVGLAVLTLLAELAEQRPLLCLVDDVHWFDHATAEVLVFVARRLAHEPVAMIFAARGDAEFRAPGLPELALSRLVDADARAVLDAHAGDLPARVRHLLLREAAGNPLALVELAAAHRAGRLADYPLGPPDAGRGGAPPTGGRVEREFAARVAALAPPVRTLLMVAAADGSCDTGLVVAAAARLGASIADAEEAERAGLLMFTSGCIGFPHPLMRAAVYGAETLGRKQAAHRALADTIDEAIDPDRWAWHRAAAAIGPDEDAAQALERTARRARERGSPESAAAAYERAAALSADPAGRGARLAAAAAAAADAGQRQWAGELSARAARHLHDPVSRARLALIDAALADADDRPEEAVELLFGPAEAVAAVDKGLATDLLTWVVESGWAARDAATVRRAAQAVLRLELPGAGHVLDLAEVAAAHLGDDLGQRPPRPRAALPVCGSPDSARGTAKMARWSLVLGDHRRAHELAGMAERTARARGELGVLPDALAVLALTRWYLGLPREALAAAAEGLRIARDVGLTRPVESLAGSMAQLAAVSGDEVACEAALAGIGAHRRTTAAATARSLLDLSAGRFAAAADRLADLTATASEPQARAWLPDLVEAAARAGRADLAGSAANRFARWADRVDLPWARALALRCRALTTEGRAAGELYAEAVAVHRSEGDCPEQPARPGRGRHAGPHSFERARTELLYGEWLRRARQRTAARSPLRSACETFDDLGATPWAARARAELRATGESRADPPPDGHGALTPQELQVVRLAAEGMSNREIAAQLFLSPRTVGYHLHKAFPKLGVASRAQLARLDLPA